MLTTVERLHKMPFLSSHRTRESSTSAEQHQRNGIQCLEIVMSRIKYRGITIFHQEKCKVVNHHDKTSGHHWTERVGTGKFFYSIGDGVRVSCNEEFKTLEDAQERIDYQLKQMELYPELYAKIPRRSAAPGA